MEKPIKHSNEPLYGTGNPKKRGLETENESKKEPDNVYIVKDYVIETTELQTIKVPRIHQFLEIGTKIVGPDLDISFGDIFIEMFEKDNAHYRERKNKTKIVLRVLCDINCEEININIRIIRTGTCLKGKIGKYIGSVSGLVHDYHVFVEDIL